jgi:hypothetical protein
MQKGSYIYAIIIKYLDFVAGVSAMLGHTAHRSKMVGIY